MKSTYLLMGNKLTTSPGIKKANIVFRLCLAFVLSIFSVTNASAVITVTTDDGSKGACVGSMVEVIASGTNDHWVQFQYRVYGEGSWKDLNGVTSSSSTLFPKMPNNKVYFRVIDTEDPANSSDPDGVEVGVRTEGCPAACVVSDAGAYIHGTDFDLIDKSSHEAEKPAIPADIESYFMDGDAKVQFSKNEVNNYKVTTEIESYFGPGLKPKNNANSNFYYTYDDNTNKGKPFTYVFPYGTWHDQPYTFKMVFYLYFDSSCGMDDNAAIKLETGQGNFGSQKADVNVYIDSSDELVSSSLTSAQSFGHAKVFEPGNLQNGAKEHGKDYLKNKLLRVEATFYGVFPHTNQKLGPNLDGTTWNNDDDFGMYPLFEQFGSCCKMAIDFISAELPSVCLSDQSKCKSDTTIKVNAAGFPEDVVKGGKFKWYYRLANGTWSELTNLEGKSEVDIKIDFLGKRHFKVVGLSSNEYIAVDKREITIEFDLGGLDCEPAGPDKITTDSRTCLPKTGALEIPFKVTPELSDPDVRYGWSLIAPDGKTVYVNRDKTTNAVIMDLLPAGALVQPDKLFNSDFSNWRSGRIVIPAAFVASMPAGDSLKYTLTVQQYKKGKTDTWKSVNDPKSSVLTFYRTPDASFALSQGNVEGDPTKICPYVSPVEFTANTTNKGGYTYLWSIAAGGSFEKTNEKTAGIKLPIDCDVKTLSGVNLTVSVTAMPTCKDSKSKDVEISRELPEVKCPVGADIVKDLDKIECPDKTVPVLLHMPQIINTCDPDPLVTIDFEGSYIDDKVVKPYSHPQIKAKLSKLTEALLTIDAPVTKSSVSNGYIRAIYNAYDACNNKSAKPCTLLITVVDTKGPNISCEEKAGGKRILGDIVVKMSEVGNDVCDGVNVTIQAPVLTDLCDNSKITGEFWMTSEPKTPTLSDKFLIGKTTTITWRFYDHAGNYSECHQDVVVVDDRKPKLNCPATDETLEISTDVKTCNTSAASALKQILDLLGNVEPSATNYCGTTDKIDKTVKWSADGLTWKDTAKAVFAKDETYSVRWEFSRHYIDANGDPQVAVDYCVQKFIIKDKVKPEVDCSMVDNIIANVNIKTRQRVYSSNGQIHNYTYKEDYASAVLPDGESDGVGDKVCKDDPEVTYYTDDCSKVKGPAKPGDKDNLVDVIHNVTDVKKGPGPGGTYTYKSTPGYEFKFSLAEQLVEANIPTATDRCDGVLLPKIVISDKNGVENVVPGATVAEMVEAMRKFKFMVENSPYTVKYVFTDSEGNSDLCEHTITAVRQGAPITNCWEDSAHLAANDVCEATTEDYSYAKVPSATIKYNLVTISAGSKEKVEEISKTIYPYKIVRDYFVFTDKKTGEYDESTPTTHLEALNDSPLKSHKTTQYIAPAVGTDKSIKIYESKATPEAWKDVLATTFPLGVTKISLYYQNMSDNSNKEVYEESVCTAYIVVADETDPVVDCKAFAGTITKQISKDELAKNNCIFTWEQVGLTKPEVSQLDIKDNCSGNSTDNAENFTIEGYRYYHGLDGTEAGDEYKESDAEFKGNFQIGTTEVIWRIFDESGNSDPNVCRQNVVVVDDEAPECPTLKDITVAVQNDVVGCYANAVDVQKHPNFNANVTAEDDHCSPTGADIPYFKVERSDDKTLTDKYPAGTTVITWWFKDNALVQNEIGCPQNVVVTDSAGPKFDCKSEDRTYEIETGCTFSSDKVEWYVPSPTDNCDGDDPKNMVFTLILQQMKSKTEVKPGTSAEKYVYNTNTLQYSPVIPDLVAGIHKASWVITDSKGNESDSCTFYVHVKDTIPPRPVCPEGVNVNAPVDECEAVVSLDPEDYKIIDPCDGVEIVPTWKRSDDATSLDAPFHVGDTYVTWTWTDTTGNSHSCEQLIHVKDVTPPVATCTHVGDTIEVPTYTCEATSADLRDNGLKSPTATDECQSLTPDRTTEVYYKGVSGLESPVKQVDTNGNPIPWTDLTYRIGYYTIDFIFTDTTGNSSKCSVDVFIKDISAPEVECPNSRVVESPALNECKFDFDASLTNPSIGVEHCLRTSISPVAHIFDKTANDYKEEILEFPVSISAGDSIDIRWDYISKYGYSTSCYQRLVVVDNQWPDNFCETLGLTQIDLVADPEKCEHTVAPGDIPVPSFEDNCGTINGELVSYIYVSGSKPDTTIVDNVIPTSFRTGKTILRWRFHDTAHEDSCEQMVFVKGSIAPDIDCDTFRTFFDTVPECDTRSVAVRTPYAIDVCAPEGVSDSVAGVPSRSDGLAIDAPFPLGNTVVTWTFTDFTGNVSSSCKDTVNVRTEKEMEITCVDEINPDMKEGDCDYQVTVPVATAKHPCLNVTFPGTPYLKGSTKPLPVVDGKLDYKFHVGKYKLLWVFVDSVTNSLVKSIDTCVTDVQIGNKNQMPVDCDNYPAIKKSLAGNCTIDAADLGFNDPEVVDLCTGQTIVPYIYRTLRDKPSDTLKVEQLGAFKVGEQDTIVRVFYFKSDGQEEGSSLECRQPVWILDSANIKTNCLPEDSVTTLIAEDGKCDINLDAVLDSIGTPEATDECLDHPITGKPFIYSDGVLTPVKGNEVIEVGKITIIRWLFNDPLANIDTAYCDQKVTAIGTAAPVFDCNSLDTLPFTAVGECYVELGDQDIPTPVAKDSCTKEDVLAEGVREDGTPVLGKFDVGPTKIIWTFKSPNSITPKVCEQIVWVKTDKEIDAKCGEENYPSQTFVIKDNSCSIPSDSVNIDEHTTNNPCLTDVIITGVPTRSDNLSMTDDFPIGKTIITWTFVDTTNTLVHDTAICEQVIEVKDEKEPKVDCETVFPSAKIFLDYENCSADFAMLPISVDSIPVNPCNNDIARIDTVRASGAGMHDPYEVGKDTITWTFTFEMTNQSFSCTQFIEVIDTLAPDFDCDALPDSVVVALSSGDSVSFQDVKDAGFIIPVVTDKCCEVTTTITRDDNKALEGNYGLGNTVVLF
ncbi:MAG: hypothetical protein KBT32_08465, partial [Bacteroidales bacterium]|nr:hypothetical protein [Candidatus Physcocola equi]